ncbi:uncharacterized protein LOC113389508 [Ctenocephalides felis]|uniref:uncharacterized protein LOC113389508 n=1 Tax=Ctenocephalides felis TaxID=7515 RepID=UPI000E6E3BCF|nr:uncharacterized protein LOC113389508 [Ctenocephalides felis]
MPQQRSEATAAASKRRAETQLTSISATVGWEKQHDKLIIVSSPRNSRCPVIHMHLLNQQPSSLIIHQTIQSSTSESTALITYNPTNSKKLSSIYQAIQSSTSDSTALIAYNPSNNYQVSIRQFTCTLLNRSTLIRL